MAPKKIVVFGGTGLQGGGVVMELLSRGGYNIVVPTRDPSSNKAKTLQDQGVALVQCDLNRPEQVDRVLEGADYVFGITNFWDPSNAGKEFLQGRNMVDSARRARVKLFIWSTLPNVHQLSDGQLSVPHFTEKARVDHYIKEIGIPAAFVSAGFYYSNFRHFFPPKQDGEDLVFTLPADADLTLPGVDPQDMGKAVAMILESPDKYQGQYTPVFGENKTIREYLKDLSDETGKKVCLKSVSVKEYQASGAKGAEELGEMFSYFRQYSYYGEYDLRKAAKFSTFKEWYRQSGWDL